MVSVDDTKIELLRQLTAAAKHVAIVGHVNPDGDAIGSVLGLSHLLPTLGFGGRQSLLLPNPVPRNLRFLPGADTIINATDNFEACRDALADADLIFCVDHNNFSRVEALQQALASARGHKVLIDHHHNPQSEGVDAVFSYPDISSTCELILWIADAMQPRCLNAEAALCLYAGMCTDTGSFAYSNEQPSLYEAVARTMEFDIHPAWIHNQLFCSESIAHMQFLGFCLSERLRIFEQYGFSYIFVSEADQKRYGIEPPELDGIVNYTLSMEGIEVGAMIKETFGKVRISFRAKGDFDVNSFAQRHWGGGGHTKASGATSSLPFDETVQQVERLLKEELGNSSKF